MKTGNVAKNLVLFIVGAWVSVTNVNAAYLTWDGAASNNLWDTTSVNWSGVAWDNSNAAIINGNGSTMTITTGTGIGLTRVTSDDNTVMKVGGSGNIVFNGQDLNILDGGDANGDHNLKVNMGSGNGVTFNNFINSVAKMRLAVEGGSYITLNSGLTTIDKELQIGWFGNGTVNFAGGSFTSGQISRTVDFNISNVNVTSSGGHSGSKGVTTISGTAVVSFGGDVNNNTVAQSNDGGGFVLINGDVTFRNDGFSILKANGTGVKAATLDVRGGTLTSLGDKGIVLVNASSANGNGAAVYLQSGGTVITKGIKFAHNNNVLAATTTASATISGGVLFIGDQGIKKGDAGAGLTSSQISFTASSGTIGAIADWNSDVDMKLTGNVTLQASGTNSDQHNITLQGALSGNGGITKTGNGTLLLQGVNTYTGNTAVSAGVLTLDTMGSLTFVLGADGVNNKLSGTGGTINLNGGITINLDVAAANGTWLIIDKTGLTLNYGSGFSVAGWTQDSGNTNLWTLGAYSFDKSTGIVSAIPEPSTYALLGVGILILFVGFARRRRAV